MRSIVGGTSFSASQTWREARTNPRGSLRSSSMLEFERPMCSMSTRIPALGASPPQARSPRRERPGLGPVRKFEADEDAVGSAMSQRRPKRSWRRARSGSGSCAMMRLASRRAAASSSGAKLLGLGRRVHAEELDVVHLMPVARGARASRA
jgi:hypothetical protein